MTSITFPTRSTWIHLRFLYSLYLLPVFLFALSQSPQINIFHALLAFFILHFLIYPASNGYNSYYDQDEGSIGGIKEPPKVDISLLYTSLALDVLGIILGFAIHWSFSLGLFIYGLFSKLYSNRKTRLKSRPIISFLVVFFFQGAFIFFISLKSFGTLNFMEMFTYKLILGGLFTSFLVGASYVLTQVYQHKEDQLRGDISLSALLGYRGTFLFSGFCFLTGTGLLLAMFISDLNYFWPYLLFTSPLVLYFLFWFMKVWGSDKEANFKNAMRMSTLSFLCLSAYFLFLFWIKNYHGLIIFY